MATHTMSIKPDFTAPLVLSWMEAHADDDGIVTAPRSVIAAAVGKPTTTIQGALGRLETQNKVYMMSYGRYIVCALVDRMED